MKQTQMKKHNIYFIVLMIISVAFLMYMVPFRAEAQENINKIMVKPKPVEQQSEFKPHVGLLTGLASPEGNYRSSAEYGITIGYQPYIPFGVGLELSSTYSNVSAGPEQYDLQRTKLLVQGTYNFGGSVPIINKSYVGIAVGPMLESINSDDSWVIGTMPTLGFDYPFALDNGKDISAGLNARYLISSSGEPNTFSVNAMAKYWF